MSLIGKVPLNIAGKFKFKMGRITLACSKFIGMQEMLRKIIMPKYASRVYKNSKDNVRPPKVRY